MDPYEYQEAVAAQLRAEGYATEARPTTNDWGVDLFATRGKERLATDGELRRDAEGAAEKLGIRVLFVDSRGQGQSEPKDELGVVRAPAVPRSGLDFESIWAQYVIPLAGRTLTNEQGLRNKITQVNWGGVQRVTSTGARGWIPIEPSRWAIETILEFGSVTRQEINEQYAGRASSGIQLVLAQVPLFEVDGRPSTIRLRSG